MMHMTHSAYYCYIAGSNSYLNVSFFKRSLFIVLKDIDKIHSHIDLAYNSQYMGKSGEHLWFVVYF